MKMYQPLVLVLVVMGCLSLAEGGITWYNMAGGGQLGHSDDELTYNAAVSACITAGAEFYTYSTADDTTLIDQLTEWWPYWVYTADPSGGLCTRLYHSDGRVDTKGISCTLNYQYICYIPPTPEYTCIDGAVQNSQLPGLCFLFVAEKKNMSETVAHCASLTGTNGVQGHMMEMTDDDRRDLAMELDQDQQIWVGNQKNAAGDWQWVYSGSTLNEAQSLYWNTGEPSGDGNCVNTYLYDRQRWADTLCRIKRAFICEFEAAAV